MELVFREDGYAKTCEATVVSADENGIRLDRTVFYAESGGQLGDQGRLVMDDGSVVEICDTKKGDSHDDVIHIPAEGSPLPATGAKVSAEIDWGRRHRLMRLHTCMHLLCAVIEGDVTGGQINDGKARLDFNLPNTSLDKSHIESELNRLIEEDHPVQDRWITDREMADNPDLVRTMSVKPPMSAGRVRLLEIEGTDLQPCGGTHVARTGEIGRVRVGKIENKGRQNRRINVHFADQ